MPDGWSFPDVAVWGRGVLQACQWWWEDEEVIWKRKGSCFWHCWGLPRCRLPLQGTLWALCYALSPVSLFWMVLVEIWSALVAAYAHSTNSSTGECRLFGTCSHSQKPRKWWMWHEYPVSAESAQLLMRAWERALWIVVEKWWEGDSKVEEGGSRKMWAGKWLAWWYGWKEHWQHGFMGEHGGLAMCLCTGVEGWSQVGTLLMGGRSSHPDVEEGKNMQCHDMSHMWINDGLILE